MSEDQQRAARARRHMWRFSTIGLELFGSIVGMFLLGWLIDFWVGTTNHAFKIGGLFVGLIGGMWNFYKEVKKMRASPFAGRGSDLNPVRPPGQRTGTPGPGPALSLDSPPKPMPPARNGRAARDPQLFVREYFTDEQLERIENEGEIRWPEGFEAMPGSDLDPDDGEDSEPPESGSRP